MTGALAAYVAAWGFGTSIAAGAVILLMVMNLTGATWFAPMRRAAQSIASTLPLFLLLLVPPAIGARSLYASATDPARAWMHPAPLIMRAVLYFIVWIGFAEALRRSVPARRRALSAAGVPAFGVTLSFFAFDWLMPAAPQFSSDMYGVYVCVGGFSAAVGMTVFVAWRRGPGALAAPIPPACFHAMGRVLLTSVAVWAYVAFFQFLIIWIADIPRESFFYVARAHGVWGAASYAPIFGRFVAPFFLLLSRALKLHPPSLATVGAWIVLMHALDCAWLVLPEVHGGARLIDVVPFAAVLLFGALFGAWRARRTPPSADAELARALAYESR